MLRLLAIIVTTLFASTASAEGLRGTFLSIDGGKLSIEEWRGRPILIANTASRCASTRQYDELQALYDEFRSDGLIVLAVPSQDFRQEIATSEEVKDFCTLNFDLDLPVTDMTSVRGPEAHPFFRALKEQVGYEPQWNFNKVLIGPEGEVAAAWASTMRPNAMQIVRQVEDLLDVPKS